MQKPILPPGFLRSISASVLVLGTLFAAPQAGAQSFARSSSASAEVPSASGYRALAGEKATYDVEWKGRGVGTGSLELIGHEKVEGHNTLHAALKVEGGFAFMKVNDRFDSWFDPARMFSRRFVQNQKELTSTRNRVYEIIPEKGIYFEANSGDLDSLSTAEPLDDVSFLFYVRTLPLKVGTVDTIPRYFKTGRDVIIRVLRKETITVPAGTFNTIVVQPTITNAGGLFGQGGKAEVYFTDDPSRTLVKLKSNVPVIGSLALTLRSAVKPK
jgi:hypothetical protein